jgi:tripartite-type tricarboxylate transporter receptor subunit TctC
LRHGVAHYRRDWPPVVEWPPATNRDPESPMLHLIRWSSIACALIGLPALAQAQSTYPDRPVRFVVAFPPGGATDTFFRQITPELSAALGQSVVIENKSGAGGYVGWQYVASSAPDGYTVLVGENAVGINQALYKKHPSGFDPRQHFDTIAAMGSAALGLTVANNIPPKTFAEFVAYAKAQPGKINYGHAGPGSVSHLVFEVIADAAGFESVGVAYRGGGPAAQAIVAGQVAAVTSSMAVAKGQAEGGLVKVVAVTSPNRSPALPNVPSLKELGVKHAEVDLEFWWGLFGPKGMPDAVKAKLEQAMKDTMAHPAVRERLMKVDTNPSFGTGGALKVKLDNEIANWSKVIDAKGIKPQ